MTIPSKVIIIERSLFNGCHSLQSIDFLGDVTYIGDAAFFYCYSLTSIKLPESVTTIIQCHNNYKVTVIER